ncbi:hypothetical protein OKW43_006744 [Paraburkholderia sp. WC7.3g]|uniref:phage integrase family protein n=1 Tax=Paraburkholderia sp. WC7.3g TaxID=2991070 RepID=UPI003D1B2099
MTAFVAGARKRQVFATARPLASLPAALATSASPETAAAAAPSLEDFAAWHDPDGFHTEKDLLELFTAHRVGQAAGGAAGAATLRRPQRNARLRVRQMAARDALARLVVEDPKPKHHVLGWFDTAVALRLSDVGITMIGKLVGWTINARGNRWYRDVPRLGETGARRITAWLEHYRDVDGLQIGADALAHPSRRGLTVPPLTRDPETGIVPLEYFLVPADLDGSSGANRNLLRNTAVRFGAISSLRSTSTTTRSRKFGFPSAARPTRPGMRGGSP